MSSATLAQPDNILPPTQDELPCDDGIPIETQRHKDQIEILINTLVPWLDRRADGYIGGNMFVYYSVEQVRNQDYRGPDFFAVLGVPKGERKSWVVWQEGKAPDVVIELLSPSTAERDKNEKKRIYQNQLRVSEYFWFDPFNPEDWEGFLLEGGIYQPIRANERGERISRSLELALVRWQGSFKGVEATWLRWTTLDGELLPLPEERAQQERQRAERAISQLHACALNLLQEGMSAEQVARLTGLSPAEIDRLFSSEDA
ncbi:MAG TPA: Uma2 family endonuclease [Oscillatoriales cyanobacterium M59_W2019_021]|nr:Uma2 family endonuclease [Oscillatoriales cyanobacterium M4454_W2019_049]HIK53085.1 Uma2 family endonuclease [Oscillatoriales cyanobacterium M59_W2019_021]